MNLLTASHHPRAHYLLLYQSLFHLYKRHGLINSKRKDKSVNHPLKKLEDKLYEKNIKIAVNMNKINTHTSIQPPTFLPFLNSINPATSIVSPKDIFVTTMK